VRETTGVATALGIAVRDHISVGRNGYAGMRTLD